MNKAKIIADSICYKSGIRITTFEVLIHRFVLSENNTHRSLSRNSASSRAIPTTNNIDYIVNNTAYPLYWGKNCSGMSPKEEIAKEDIPKAIDIWTSARDIMIDHVKQLNELGVHKQLSNRLIENFGYQKIIITATEYDNYFWLRTFHDAQAEIRIPVTEMLELYQNNIPEILYDGEWHTPYVEHTRIDGDLYYIDNNNNFLSLENALKVSVSCCGQVSYRKNNDSLNKALDIFNKMHLLEDDENTRKHGSVVEHQATPIIGDNMLGITHTDVEGNKWSGNLKGWIQYRHLFKNESCKKYPHDKLNFTA